MYSSVIKLAIDVNRIVLDDITKLVLGVKIDSVEVVVVAADHN